MQNEKEVAIPPTLHNMLESLQSNNKLNSEILNRLQSLSVNLKKSYVDKWDGYKIPENMDEGMMGKIGTELIYNEWVMRK